MKRTPLARKTPMSSGSKGMERGASSLRRTPIARSSPVDNAPGDRPKRSRIKPVPRKGADVLAAAQAVVRKRAKGRCERCTRHLDRERGDVHHRRPRQMGGDPSPETNSPSNLVLLCRDCHEWCERLGREEAIRTGWIIRRGVAVPAQVVLHPLRGGPFRLNDSGDLDPV